MHCNLFYYWGNKQRICDFINWWFLSFDS